MNDKCLQLILEWGKGALELAVSGEQESAHMDMLLGDSFLKETAVDDFLLAMDYLLEFFASECLSRKITILGLIPLTERTRLVILPPTVASLTKNLSESAAPEIYFLPKNTDIGCIIDGEEYQCSYPLKTKIDGKHTKRQLFCFYRCWRASNAIDNNWAEYERHIYRVFDPSEELLWGYE